MAKAEETSVEDEEREPAEGAGESTEGGAEGSSDASQEGSVEGQETEAGEEEPSAADLQARIEALEAENKTLKAGKEEAEPEPPPTVAGDGMRPPAALRTFVDVTMPRAKKAFAEAFTRAVTIQSDGTVKIDTEQVEQQFDGLLGTSDQFLTSVFRDKQDPINRELGRSVIDVSNELELTQLFIKPNGTINNRAMGLSEAIRKEFRKLSWDKRAEPGVVRGIYHRLIGSASESTPVVTGKTVVKPASTQIVRDAAAGAGGGTGRRPISSVTLNADQESERKSIEEESGHPFTTQQYAAKLKARNDLRKERGQAPIKTLKSTS